MHYYTIIVIYALLLIYFVNDRLFSMKNLLVVKDYKDHVLLSAEGYVLGLIYYWYLGRMNIER